MKVVKFGGSSLASGEQFQKVKRIVSEDKERTIVVVSAPGKANSDDIKITDLLYTLCSHIRHGVPGDELLQSILTRYETIEKECGLPSEIKEEMELYFSNLTKDCSEGEVVSRGEYFCAKLMARYLGFTFVDAAQLLFFTFNGEVDVDKSCKAVLQALEKYHTLVVPGFYGAYPNGDVHLFSRGGSDITGSYLAAFTHADEYENWTDVSGIFAVDPRLVSNVKVVQRISYDELRELSCMGANVLHEDSVKPCQDACVPIHILNTNKPLEHGTLITNDVVSPTAITGIAGKKGYVSFTIHKRRMANEIGFVYRALAIFTKYHISIEHLPTGMDTVAFIVDENKVRRTMHQIVADLEAELDCKIELQKNIAMLAIVGEQLRGNIIPMATILEILKDNEINSNCVIKAPDEVTMILAIQEKSLQDAIRVIYIGLSERNLI